MKVLHSAYGAHVSAAAEFEPYCKRSRAQAVDDVEEVMHAADLDCARSHPGVRRGLARMAAEAFLASPAAGLLPADSITRDAPRDFITRDARRAARTHFAREPKRSLPCTVGVASYRAIKL